MMTGNTSPASMNTRTGSVRGWTVSAVIGSIFAVLLVIGVAFPSMLGTTGDSLRGASNSRPRPSSAAIGTQEPRNLRATAAMPNGKVGSVPRNLMDGSIWDITWPSDIDEDSGKGFYAAWGPDQDSRSTKDQLPKVKNSLFGLTETQRSVSWQLALENDLMEIPTSYSYGFGAYPETSTDYSYGFGAYPETSTDFSYGFGAYPETSTDYSYGFGAFPETSTDYSYGFGAYPETSTSYSYGFDTFPDEVTRFMED